MTARVDVIGIDGTKDGTVQLPPEIFDVQVNVPLIHQVVVAQLAAARQGTHSTKSRGEVRGGGRKPYRQKGTGRARQGSIRAPQFAGGGVVHGPTPRSYEQRTPKKMKAAALRGALSDRARNGRVHVVTGFVEGDTPSTRDAVSALTALSQRPNLLVVMPRADVLGWKSLRNAPGVHLLFPDQLNTYDVLISDDVVFTRAALDEFIAARAQGTSVKASAREDELAPRAADEIDGADEDVADHDAAAEVHAADDAKAAADQVVTPPQAAVDEALGTEAAVDEAAVDAAADDAAGRKESTP